MGQPAPVVYAISDHDLLNSRSQGLGHGATSAAQAEVEAKLAALLAQDPDEKPKAARVRRPANAPPTEGPGVPIPVGPGAFDDDEGPPVPQRSPYSDAVARYRYAAATLRRG